MCPVNLVLFLILILKISKKPSCSVIKYKCFHGFCIINFKKSSEILPPEIPNAKLQNIYAQVHKRSTLTDDKNTLMVYLLFKFMHGINVTDQRKLLGMLHVFLTH